MSGSGFPEGAYSYEWYMAWIGLAVIVVLFLIFKKWLGEEEMAGYKYSVLGSFAGFILHFFVASLWSSKWAFVIGFLGLLAGGFGVGYYEE